MSRRGDWSLACDGEERSWRAHFTLRKRLALGFFCADLNYVTFMHFGRPHRLDGRRAWLAAAVAGSAAVAAFALLPKLNVWMAIAAAVAVGLVMERANA